MPSVILFIIDGLGDLPTPKTALEAAKKPNMDALAQGGVTGLLSPISLGVAPGSDVSHLQILGYDPLESYNGRGPLEALGSGMELKDGDVAFRANFATVKKGAVVDRRAGRISSAEAKKLEDCVNTTIDGVQIVFKSTSEHRGALVLHGQGLSASVTDTDTHKEGEVGECVALDSSPEAMKTADIVNKFTKEVQESLSVHAINLERKMPANAVLLRSGGGFRKVPPIGEKYGVKAACIAGGALYKGIARYVGMDVIEVKGATGDAKTDLKAKAKAAIEAAAEYDLVFMHVKAADSFGHDGNFDEKVKMLEKIDKDIAGELKKAADKKGIAIIITGDHSTPCIRKEHSGHEVPILIYCKNERSDGVESFDEESCMAGGLGHIRGKNIMPLILNVTGKGKKYGS